MAKQRRSNDKAQAQIYGVFRNGGWVTEAPVFTERQTAEIWLAMRKPPDGYKGATVKDLRNEAHELRKKAAKVLVDAERESRKLLAAAEKLEAVPVPLPGTNFSDVQLTKPETTRGAYSSFGRGKDAAVVVPGGLPGLGKRR
ncbi:hypothetical protein [Burkholderia glumae]|uniref:hypothetical protein n=1 Tax=Burkholderia glumae TaxID=337 RepID=UPI002150F2FE|nr:hypothetical protein [Burkholderia glumae]